MAQVLKFPTSYIPKKVIEEKIETRKQNNIIDPVVQEWQNYQNKINRYKTIMNGFNRDSYLVIAFGVAEYDIGERRPRERNEDEYMNVYNERISFELNSSVSSDFLKRILKECHAIVEVIRKIRAKLYNGGISERESYEIGAKKRELRAKLVKYLLLKEGYYDVNIQEKFENDQLRRIAI